MRYFFASVILLVGFQTFGQSYNRCVPNRLADTATINQCFNSAQYYFDNQDYQKAASFFHKAERIIPDCPEIRENLAACYWEFYQSFSSYDVKHMLLAKKYLELCLQDRFISKSHKSQYQNCLDEVDGVLDKILVQKSYGNGRYYGEMHNGKRDGFGVFYFNNGQRYEGLWIDDKKEDLEGELYNHQNELIYKGVFYNDQKYDYEKLNLMEEVKYWESIENSNDIAAYRRYLEKYGETGLYKVEANERIAFLQPSNQNTEPIATEIDGFISDNKKKMRKQKLGANFIDVTYSLSGYYSFRTGAMYHAGVGYYGGFGIKGNVIKDGINGINSIRYTLGALYAPTDWLYVYAGGGFSVDGLNSQKNLNPTADLGLLFRLGFVSLSTGLQVDNIPIKPSIDYSFGLGLNLNAFRTSYPPFTYYVFSPMAPYGIMCAWYRNSTSGYFKIQIPMYGEKIQELIAPDYKNHPVRYSYTAGMTTSLSSWFGFYAGMGLGVYKDKLDDKTKKQGLDAEIGANIRISHVLSLSAGLHGVNLTDRNRFLTYDVGIGINTWKLFLKRANHSIWEYSFSETADVGLMNGFIYEWYGYYGRIQMTNPFQKNKQHNNSEKWNGTRYSMTIGPIIALTDWLYIHGGLGAGLYNREDNDYKTTDVGFETELGISLRVWLLEVSYGPHWCRVGKDDAFLDHNIGIGINIPYWLGNSAFENNEAPFWRYRYSRTAQIGFDVGKVWDEGGFYFGMQGGIPFPFRVNVSGGLILTPSALMHFSFGPGIGFYSTNGSDAALGFDMEAMCSFVLWKLPVTIGLKFCRIGSPHMYIEPIYGLGWMSL